MPFFAVFDPSTLRINVDLPFLGSQQMPEVIKKPLSDGINWDGKTFDVHDNWQKSADRELYVQICSAIWHEKRHFLDYVLTDYGQFELRLYSQIYGNYSKILDSCRSERLPLVVPVTALRDKARRKVLNVDGYDFKEVSDVAESIYSRRQLLEIGSNPIDIGDPSSQKYSIGGKAQLEALGFYCQASAIRSAFGPDALAQWQERLGVGDWRVRYRWPERYLWSRGIDVRSGSKDTDITLIGALLLASLMTRGWNQESAGTGEQDKYPAGRLRLLSEEIGHRRNQLPRPGDTDPGAVWAVLNQAAEKIFGRSIVEELKQDFAREKEFIENHVKNFDPPAIAAITDVHRLRGELIDVLTARPQEFFDPVCWSMTMLPKLHVGCTRLYPAGLKTCFGITWAGRFGETERFETEYGLRETEAWRKVESAATTFAKFMVNGRVDPALIPGALAKLEEQLADQYGVTILVERSFAYPPRSGTQAFFRLAQVDDLPCDICNKNVHKPRGCLIPSFTVRVERPPNAESQDARFKDDWRDWLACEECARRYASFGSKLS